MTELKPVNNCWTLYTEGLKGDLYAEIGRPQDWGHPRWMYRVYVLEAQGYRNTVHCWLDQQVKEHEHLGMFSKLITTITRPGTPVEVSGRDFLKEDDLWDEKWGAMPPHYENDDDDEYGDDDDLDDFILPVPGASTSE